MIGLAPTPSAIAQRVELADTGPPLKIAILSYRSDPKVGGQGVYVDYLSSALADAGADVDVISGPPYPDLEDRVGLIKIPSLDLYAQPYNGHYALRAKHLLSATDTYEYFGHLSGKFVEPYTFGQRVFSYLRRSSKTYDVVFDNQGLSVGIGKLASRLGIPLATMIHHPITHDRRLALEAAPDTLHRWLVRRWYAFHHMQIAEARKLSAITCPSALAKRDIVEQFGVRPDRIHPIPLGVDHSAFFPSRDTKRKPQTLITTASSDTPLKGLSYLIEAYHQVLKRYPACELIVIGTLRDGAARRTLEALGLQGRVVFKSDLTRSELANEFRRATIAVSPSLYEGFGLPAAEAMSCATPVVVTDGGALPEVAGDAGLIVPRANADALATAVLDLLDHPSKQSAVSEACLKRAKAQFDWNAIAPRYIEFFRKTIAARIGEDAATGAPVGNRSDARPTEINRGGRHVD